MNNLEYCVSSLIGITSSLTNQINILNQKIDELSGLYPYREQLINYLPISGGSITNDLIISGHSYNELWNKVNN